MSQLQELTKLLVEVQGLVSYGTFNTTGGGSCLMESPPAFFCIAGMLHAGAVESAA